MGGKSFKSKRKRNLVWGGGRGEKIKFPKKNRDQEKKPGQPGGWAPPLLGFPHAMLSVKRVKDNMQLAFIEKFFTNCEIGTNVQTRYLRFKGMSYESESYLNDINCVQLWKVLARFRCDNT